MTSELKSKLIEATSERAVSDDRVRLSELSSDYTEEEARRPALVVSPTTTEEVSRVVAVARSCGASLTVRVMGSNVGGLALAPVGGVIVDLSKMNRIIEVDPDEMYALIEPGVTWQQLKDHIEQAGLALRMGYPLSPPDTSIIANCLLDGLGNLSMRYGAMAEWIGGLEAVLPDASVVRTGAAALSDRWFGRGPLPDLTGLFVSWQGTTGIVTKLAFQLWPQPPERRRMFVMMYDRNVAFRAMRDLCRLQCCDDVGGLSWPTGKMLLGIDRPAARQADEPEFFLYLDVSGDNALELSLRLSLLEQYFERLRREGHAIERPVDVQTLVKLHPSFAKFAEFPTRLDFLVDNPGGGLTWVGTYGPMSRFEPYADRGLEIMARYAAPPIIVSRPMKGGHFGVMRFIATFDKEDADQRRQMRELNGELIDAGVELGFIPYKTPPWVVSRLQQRFDPGFAQLLRRLRQTLDPEGIMAPHAWPL